MTINYYARLCFGFEVPMNKVLSALRKEELTVTNGKFHRNVKYYFEFNNLKINSEYGDFDDAIVYLENSLNCYIERVGDFPANKHYVVFYVNTPVSEKDEDYGKLTLYNTSLSLSKITELTPKILSLKGKLNALGIMVNEPACFLSMKIF